jgi:hypothetical protein
MQMESASHHGLFLSNQSHLSCSISRTMAMTSLCLSEKILLQRSLHMININVASSHQLSWLVAAETSVSWLCAFSTGRCAIGSASCVYDLTSRVKLHW